MLDLGVNFETNNVGLACVREANLMACRAALLCCLVLVLNGTFIIEQPSSSLLFRHPRLQWLCSLTRAPQSSIGPADVLLQVYVHVKQNQIAISCRTPVPGISLQLLDAFLQFTITKAYFFMVQFQIHTKVLAWQADQKSQRGAQKETPRLSNCDHL